MNWISRKVIILIIYNLKDITTRIKTPAIYQPKIFAIFKINTQITRIWHTSRVIIFWIIDRRTLALRAIQLDCRNSKVFILPNRWIIASQILFRVLFLFLCLTNTKIKWTTNHLHGTIISLLIRLQVSIIIKLLKVPQMGHVERVMQITLRKNTQLVKQLLLST